MAKKSSFLSRIFKRTKGSEPAGFSSSNYWEQRYRKGGNSGAGSYNQLANFKAEVINSFTVKNAIESVIEFGSGDGNQLKLFKFKKFIGVDVSETIVAKCRKEFVNDSTKKFYTLDEYNGEKVDLSMSLDVIYHLVEDSTFEAYMNNVFNASNKYVIIYSSNFEEPGNGRIASHVRHRKFTEWVDKNQTSFQQIDFVSNKFPFDGDGDTTSKADFYFYKRNH